MPKPTTRKMKPEIREIVRWAASHDWIVQDEKDGKGHWVLWHPAGGIVRLPDTPGEYRGLENAKAQIRRRSNLPSESGPAARYRHESRRDGFSMEAALKERRQRLALADALAQARAELAAIDPRRNPTLAREVAAKVTGLEERLDNAP